MRLPVQIALPQLDGASGAAFRLQLANLLRETNAQVNLVSEGHLQGTTNAYTAPPTTGRWARGDFVRNSEPSLGAGGIVFGWICTVSGEPGTWEAITVSSAGGGSAATLLTAGATLAVNSDYVALITLDANMTLPTFAAGDTFTVTNAFESTAGKRCIIVTGAGRQINGLAAADNVTILPGETISLVASSATRLTLRK